MKETQKAERSLDWAPTWLDRVVTRFSPERGEQRLRARARAVQLDQSMRAFEAASTSRRTSGWRTNMRGPNAETGPAIHRLRARARDLSVNNGYGSKAVRLLTTRLVGPGAVPKVPGPNSRDADVALGTWRDHAAQGAVDPGGDLTVYGLQALTVREMIDAGEGLLVRRWLTQAQQRAIGAELPYQIQALEPDYLDTHRDAQLDDGGFIIQGVEYGKHGEKLAYWLHKSHPGEVYHSFASAVTDSVRVPARDVIHLREIYRSGQVRGIPRGTPVLLQLRDFDDYLDAELHRQKIAACFTAFVYDSSGLDGGFGAGLAGAEGVSPTSTGSEGNSELDDFGKLFPGAIKKLPPGTDIRLTAPPTTNGLPDYARLTLHQIAVGYGANYAEMTGDLSQANYSSGRMGHLTFAAENETVQACTLRPQLLDKLWGWHLEALMVTGRISNRVPVEWSFPRRPMVDPNKETKALTEQVQAGFVSLADVQRQLGSDPDEVLDELGEDKDRAEALGLNLSVFTSPPGTVTPNSGPEDQNVGPGDHDQSQEGDDAPEAS